MRKSLLLLAFALIAMSIQAAIPDGGWSVTPAPGSTVAKITEVTVKKSGSQMDTYINRSVKINGESIAITQKVSNDGYSVIMTLATPVEKSGEYEILVPKNTFDYDYNYFMDEGTPNPEMSWKVTVDNPDQPIEPEIPDVTVVASPASGSTVRELANVSITFEGAAKAVTNASGTSTVTLMGNPVEGVRVFYNADQSVTKEMTVMPAITASGEYTITVSEGSFLLYNDKGKTFPSPEFKLNYTVKAPPAVGERFVVDKIRYKVLSREPMAVAVTFPEDEADYAGLTTVPTSVTYEDETFAVTEIGDLAISEVSGISEFTVPEGITRIGESAFWSSTITSINIPASVTEIGEGAFEECKQLASFTLPATVATIGSDLLYGCVQLKSVTLPEGMTAIPARFVQGCEQLERLDVPSTVKTIGEFAMSECAALATTNIPDGVTELGRFAYAYCPILTKLPIPESVTTMGHGVFYQAGLTEASLPAAITVIPDGTFQCCASLEEFVIGNNVTELEKGAFSWCFALTKITFGEKVAVIGANAFDKDDALTEVICLNPEPATGAAFPQTVYDNAALTVPEGAAEAYRNAPGWKEFKDINGSAAVGSITAAPADTEVTLYNMQGVQLYRGSEAGLDIPAGATYILHRDGKATKVVR